MKNLEPENLMRGQVIVDEGDEIMQVTFILNCKIEVGFRPIILNPFGEERRGAPIYFLECKNNAIGDYECLFSE